MVGIKNYVEQTRDKMRVSITNVRLSLIQKRAVETAPVLVLKNI